MEIAIPDPPSVKTNTILLLIIPFYCNSILLIILHLIIVTVHSSKAVDGIKLRLKYQPDNHINV